MYPDQMFPGPMYPAQMYPGQMPAGAPMGSADQGAVAGFRTGGYLGAAQGPATPGAAGYAHGYHPAAAAQTMAPAMAPMPHGPAYYGPVYTHAGYGGQPVGPMGMGQGMGQGQGPGPKGPGMSELMEELAGGGNGLSSLGKMLNLDDTEFWKGALVGAAAVLLLTNESVQGALFKTGARAKQAVKSGLDKLEEGAGDLADKLEEATK